MAIEVKVNGHLLPVQLDLARGADLCALAKVSSDDLVFLVKPNADILLGAEAVLVTGGGEQVPGDDKTRIVLRGGEEFITIPADAEDSGIIDLEKCAKSGRRPPKGQKGYRIRIDGEMKVAQREKMTGAEILALVNKNPEEWSLSQKFPGGRRERIEPRQSVNLAALGVERFETSPKQIQQGVGDFGLTREDKEFLNSLGKEWSTEADSKTRMVVIRDFDMPEGYDHKTSDLMLVIPANYPVAGLDMFYLAPGIQRKDGRPINALASETHGGRQWQRWSRHYPWQSGYGLANHMDAVKLSLSNDSPN